MTAQVVTAGGRLSDQPGAWQEAESQCPGAPVLTPAPVYTIPPGKGNPQVQSGF